MWTGLGAFQDVTVRMVAEHLAHVQHGTTYVPAELVHAVVVGGIPKLTGDKRYHVYTSPHNPGASDLMCEVAMKHGVRLKGIQLQERYIRHIYGASNPRLATRRLPTWPRLILGCLCHILRLQ